MFHTPHLTLPCVGERGMAGLQAVALAPRSAIPGPRSPATAVARVAVRISGAVMLGEVGGPCTNCEWGKCVCGWWKSGSMVRGSGGIAGCGSRDKN